MTRVLEIFWLIIISIATVSFLVKGIDAIGSLFGWWPVASFTAMDLSPAFVLAFLKACEMTGDAWRAARSEPDLLSRD